MSTVGVRLRRGLRAQQQVLDLAVDEIVVALEVGLVDVEPAGDAEEVLELSDTRCSHHRGHRERLANHWLLATAEP